MVFIVFGFLKEIYLIVIKKITQNIPQNIKYLDYRYSITKFLVLKVKQVQKHQVVQLRLK